MQFNRRNEVNDDDDNDTLDIPVTLNIEDIDPKTERGRLLHLSTIKRPAPIHSKPILEPEPLPSNCITNTRRIVRIVRSPHVAEGTESLGIQVKPATRSIGVQVPEIVTRPEPAFCAPPPTEPPLKSYWTHKVNLPFPPNQNQTYTQPNSTHQPYAQPSIHYPFVPQFGNQQQIYHAPPTFVVPQIAYQNQPFETQPVFQPVIVRPQNRRERRNASKHQKYLQRKNLNH